jgi:hypothetical protein
MRMTLLFFALRAYLGTRCVLTARSGHPHGSAAPENAFIVAILWSTASQCMWATDAAFCLTPNHGRHLVHIVHSQGRKLDTELNSGIACYACSLDAATASPQPAIVNAMMHVVAHRNDSTIFRPRVTELRTHEPPATARPCRAFLTEIRTDV